MKSDIISEFLQEQIDVGDFPSAVYLVAEKSEIIFQDALGHAVVEPEMVPAAMDTIYDLASLTKPLLTGLLSAILIEKGELELGRKVENYLEEFDDSVYSKTGLRAVTITGLLTHLAGLPAWKPFYLLVNDRERILGEIVRTALNPEQPDVTYSDLNFLVLTFVIERLYRKRLDEIAQNEIFEPLGLKETFFNSPPALRRRFAATEKGNEYEKQTCIELGYLQKAGVDGKVNIPACTRAEPSNPFTFRNYQIWGEVHDGNAWFMGGVAGHAGLFSTAAEIFKIAQQFLPNYTSLLEPETCDLFKTNFTPGMNEHRSIAFQLATTPQSTAGARMSPEAFGHLGFTGTSLWIDQAKERIFILLTNRTHAHQLPFANINAARRGFHDLANELLDKLSN